MCDRKWLESKACRLALFTYMRSIGMRLESRERRYTEKKGDIMRAHAVGDFLKHEFAKRRSVN